MRLTTRGTVRSKLAFEGLDKDIPYLGDIFSGALSHELDNDSFTLAEEILRLAWTLGNEEKRTLALLVLATFSSMRQGSTCLSLEGGVNGPLGKQLSSFFDSPTSREKQGRLRAVKKLVHEESLSPIFGRPGDYRPLILDQGKLYTHRHHSIEVALASAISARLRLELIPNTTITEPTGRLSEEQKSAVATALSTPLSLVTGGPGTGKTSIVSALVNTAIKSGTPTENIVLAAPTGKAASRLQDALQDSANSPETKTVHRLLRYHSRTQQFRHNKANPVPFQLVIVDEASMVGMEIMKSLLEAMPPSATLVLLGDADQLPSVYVGSVFRELINVASIPTTRLSKNFRIQTGEKSGALLQHATNEIAAGSCQLLTNPPFFQGPDVDSVVVAKSLAQRALSKSLLLHPFDVTGETLSDSSFDRFSKLSENQSRSKFLCVTRNGQRGAAGINAKCQQALHESNDTNFRHGDPVIVLRNDYHRGLYNGDQGIVLETTSRTGLSVVFGSDVAAQVFPLESIHNNISLAFALTVHQSQGSEYEQITLVLPNQDIPLMTRELVYTAVTRARQTVSVIGDPSLLKAAAKRTVQRTSGLAERITLKL